MGHCDRLHHGTGGGVPFRVVSRALSQPPVAGEVKRRLCAPALLLHIENLYLNRLIEASLIVSPRNEIRRFVVDASVVVVYDFTYRVVVDAEDAVGIILVAGMHLAHLQSGGERGD